MCITYIYIYSVTRRRRTPGACPARSAPCRDRHSSVVKTLARSAQSTRPYTCIYIYIYIYICMYVCMYIYIYIYILVYIHTRQNSGPRRTRSGATSTRATRTGCAAIFARLLCMYIYVYMCVYVYIYIYIYNTYLSLSLYIYIYK